MESIITIIGTYGFPIAACVAMGWYVKYITDENNARMDRLNAEHKAEADKMTEALTNNTLAIQHLTDLLAYKEGGI